jgi:outer membrane protein insertion porin family
MYPQVRLTLSDRFASAWPSESRLLGVSCSIQQTTPPNNEHPTKSLVAARILAEPEPPARKLSSLEKYIKGNSLLMGQLQRPARAHLFLTVLLLLTFSIPGLAQGTAPQTVQAMQSYEGQKVASVILAGRPDLDTNQLMRNVQLKPGEPFSKAKVDASVAALKAAGHFDDVTVDIRPQADGLNVVMVMQPALYLGVYHFPGAEDRFAYSRLLQGSDYPVKTAYAIQDVQHATESLITMFRRSGYFTAAVRPEIKPDFDHGLVDVYFNVTLGKRARFGKVNIRGATPEETKKLQNSLHSFMAKIRAAQIKQGKVYAPRRLQNATQFLQNALVKQKFLASRVRLIGANYNPQTNQADIDFDVTTGPVINVKVEGAHVWGRTQRRLLPIYIENSMNEGVIQEGQQNLVSFFQAKGYFDAKVDTNIIKQPTGNTIIYAIHKGNRRKVDSVAFQGNRHIDDDELLLHVPVKKGGMISHGKYSEQLVHRSINNIQTVYKNAGYSQAKVVPQIAAESNGDIKLRFIVDEGPLDVVESFRIEGNASLPPEKLTPRGAMNLGPGKPYSQIRVQEDRNNILATYLDLGYLNASFNSLAKPSESDPHRLDVVYKIIEGPRVKVAKLITVGRKQTHQSLITTSAKIKTEQPLSESELLTAESQLYTLNVFDWAEVNTRRPITTQSDEDVVIKLHESKRNTITYGFGFEVINRGGSVPSGTVAVPGIPPVGLPSNFKTSEKTFWGPRGSFEYTRKNMRGRAESLSVSGLAARLDQRGSFIYNIPSFRNSSWSVTGNLNGEHNSENPIFTAITGGGGLQFQRNLDAKKSKSLILRYNLSYTALSKLLIPDLVPAEDQNVRLSTLSATYLRDTRDNALDAHKGMYQSFELGLNAKAFGSSVNFGRFLGQTAYYRGVGAGIVWANSLRIGLEQQFAGSRVPLSEEFFSGGGSTLRGFPLNGAGPQREIAACGDPADPSTCAPIRVPVGGNQLFIVNSELRIPVPIKKNLGIAVFYDGGNVYQHVGFHNFLSDFSNTVGGGLRYATPVGPVRIDIGHNLNSLAGIKATQIFVTLGQAF